MRAESQLKRELANEMTTKIKKQSQFIDHTREHLLIGLVASNPRLKTIIQKLNIFPILLRLLLLPFDLVRFDAL